MTERLGDEDGYEAAIPSYLHSNPALRWMAWRRVEVMGRQLEKLCRQRDPRQTVIMDFGCGSGVLLGESARCADRVYGVDLVLRGAEMLVEEWGLKGVSLLTPPQAQKELEDGSLDLVLAAEVLEHIDPLDDTLRFFQRALKPSGSLLISVPTENRLYRYGRKLAGFSGHYHHSNASSIDREITRFGFRRRRLTKIPLGGPLSIYWVVEYQPAAAGNGAP